jgi:L-fuculose-phosphate aldolase
MESTKKAAMDSTAEESKEAIIAHAKRRMEEELAGGAWTVKEKVALACRILCSHGHESGLAGQITARGAGGVFLTQRLGCGMSEVTASSLLQVDEELRVVEGAGMANPANRFHAWLYRVREDVRCIVHTNPPYTSALSMLGTPLVISHMDGCALYENVGFLDHWPGVPVGNEEGRLIAGALGQKSAALLAHHGVVIAGRSIEEACVLALQFERAAFLHITASSAGRILPLPHDLAVEARDWLLTRPRVEATFAYYARRELARDPQCLA